jgi:murein DD-endopeptidase MepM/ murein hydrolase activator NlpD
MRLCELFDGVRQPRTEICDPEWLGNLLVLVFSLLAAGCSQESVLTPLVTTRLLEMATRPAGLVEKEPQVVASSGQQASSTPEISLTPSIRVPSDDRTTPTPTAVSCSREVCSHNGHFLLTRPIAPPGRDWIDPTYRYGSTQEGSRETHHGVEFLNSQGTPVLAAADGVVVVAGNDEAATYAAWPSFYGNLVIIEHDLHALRGSSAQGFPERLYTLYAHLFEINVQTGQQVEAGDAIGLVGFTGTAIGSHLHFEVRLGVNDYASTRNPELWLKPRFDEAGQLHGALAGRVLDEFGDPIYLPNVVVERLAADGETAIETRYLESYADSSVSGDDLWQENFALGDLPAGEYRVSFVARGLREYVVTVYPGRVTLLTFNAKER